MRLFSGALSALFILSLFFLWATPLYSVEIGELEVSVEEKVIFGTEDELPQWASANQWGAIQETNLQNVLELSFSQHIVFNEILSLDYIFRPVINASDNSQLQLNEFYGQFDLFGFSLYAGKKRQTIGDVYDPLSTGSMIISGNAEPITKVSGGFFDYVTMPYSNGLLEIKGALSHGWFDNWGYTKDLLLHEKYAYAKLNLPFHLSPYAGLVHEVMWGGKDDEGDVVPISLETYKDAFYAKGSDENRTDYKLGNHLGIWDVGIYGAMGSVDYHGYYQHYFEDSGGFKELQNGSDGLWGLAAESIPLPSVDALLYEFLKTTHQSGKYHDRDGDVLGGHDSYYHHYIYDNGWTHVNRVLGNSLFSAAGEGEDLRIANNRILAHHVGVKGKLRDRIEYTVMLTYAQYYPAYGFESLYDREEKQFHSMLELTYLDIFDIEGLDFSGGLYYDNGTIGQKVAGSLSIEWKN